MYSEALWRVRVIVTTERQRCISFVLLTYM